jgi:hypothetical protein
LWYDVLVRLPWRLNLPIALVISALAMDYAFFVKLPASTPSQEQPVLISVVVRPFFDFIFALTWVLYVALLLLVFIRILAWVNPAGDVGFRRRLFAFLLVPAVALLGLTSNLSGPGPSVALPVGTFGVLLMACFHRRLKVEGQAGLRPIRSVAALAIPLWVWGYVHMAWIVLAAPGMVLGVRILKLFARVSHAV